MNKAIFTLILCLAGCAASRAGGPPTLPVVYGPFPKSDKFVEAPANIYTWSNTHTPYTVFRLLPNGTSKEVENARNHSDTSWPVRPGEVLLKMKSTGQKLLDGSVASNECYWCETDFMEIDRISYLIPMRLPPGTNRIEYRDGKGNWNFYREAVNKSVVWLPIEATSSFRIYRRKP